MTYLPIEDYGLIGDMHTAALVGRNGSIDWLCLPRFDAPSVFGAILDHRKGGRFRIHPAAADVSCRQFYWPDTNVLVTRFLTEHGAAELTDFMPIAETRAAKAHHGIVRRVTAVRGTMRMRIDCRPAFDYGREDHRVQVTGGGARFESSTTVLGLATDVPLRAEGSAAVGEVTLAEGQSAVFVLRMMDGEGGMGELFSTSHAEQAFRDTVGFWRAWIGRCRYQGRWREMVHRSLLTLKLLTYEPTGAIVAAPTTSLPEGIGGERNWDYRYTWIRDSAFTLYAFLRLGYREEACRYVGFLNSLEDTSAASGSPLQIMYGIDGRPELTERTLDHLEGYRGSAPVRVGNGAYDQLQLDIYGELIDALYLYDKWGEPMSTQTWRTVQRYANWVVDNWQRKDEGIWEVRGGQREFVYSRLMSWVALDRALRITRRRSFPAPVGTWMKARNAIYDEIMTRGFDADRGAFVMSYGDRSLDAATLMMPLTLFTAPTDPEWLSTLDAMMKPPEAGGLLSNSLVYRYNVEETQDGLAGEEGTFNICTFWLVEALTRAGRYRPELLDQARLIFERMLGFASPLGLYAEETGSRGEALGNYPQAFTHLALMSAAYNLDRTLGKD
ncbi:MAG: glycoside hydrolase family 15 protein [Sandaracinaceae bacterium]